MLIYNHTCFSRDMTTDHYCLLQSGSPFDVSMKAVGWPVYVDGHLASYVTS